GSVVVTTETGEVRLPAGTVASISAGDGPRTAAKNALAALPKGDAAAAYRLAVSLEEKGVADVAKDAFERVIAADPDHAAARRAPGFERMGDQWVPLAEAKRRNGLVLWKGEWLLPAELTVRAKSARTVRVKDDPLYAAMKTAATAEPGLARVALDRVQRATTAE